jgi:4-amino-4-deoxy-L-arabinose transferase-like glycosyltransferase
MLGIPTRTSRPPLAAVVAGWFARRFLERAALVAVAGFFLLYGLGAYGILNDNESLYALIAGDMLAHGTFGIPMLNGVPYLEKPPLLPWLLAAVYAIAGQSEAASRSLPVMSTWILIAAMTLATAAHTRRRVGWLTGLILASSIFQILIFRTLLPDALLAFFFALAMLAFFRWHIVGGRAALVASYACLGMAVLAKGFVALALGLATFLAFAMVAQRRWRIRELADPAALVALIVIAGAWPLYLAIVNRDYAWFFVVNEHVLRYLGLREPRDYYGGPLYYYLPRIALFMFPWTVFLPLLALRRGSPMSDLEKLCWAWFAVALLVFSFSSAKANYYMSVAAPALAVLLAHAIDRALHRGTRPVVVLSLLAGVVAAVALADLVIAARPWLLEPRTLWIAVLRHEPHLKSSLLVSATLFALAGALLVRRLDRAALCVVACAGAPLLMLFLASAEHADRYLSQRVLAEYLRRNYPDARVFLFQDFEKLASLPFYLKRPVAVVDSRSADLAFGMRQAPRSPGFVTSAQFAAISSAAPVALIVHRRRLAAYRESLGELGLPQATRVGNVALFVGVPAAPRKDRSTGGEARVPEVGDQHVTRRMRDAERRPRLEHHGLRRDAAGPE